MDWMNVVGGLVSQAMSGQQGQQAQNPMAGALSQMFQSSETPAFGQLAGQMFGNSNGNQQSGMLNMLLASAGPAVLQNVLGNTPALAGMLGGGGPRQLTADEASQIPPEEIQHLAGHLEKHDPSIIDQVSEFYSQHPGVIQSLGGAALSMVMANMAQRTQNQG